MSLFRVSLHGAASDPTSTRHHPCALPVSFDDALTRLAALPRCHAEPDGSFACQGRFDQRPWSWEGNLYEGQGAVHYVDLWGDCPSHCLRELFTILRGGADRLLVQATHRGAWISEQEFLLWVDQQWSEGPLQANPPSAPGEP